MGNAARGNDPGKSHAARAASARSRMPEPPAKFVRLSHLRRMRGSEQVAAVCYRRRGHGIEFLLVRTRGGRWTFPKGSAEPGLTHAQAAALEAFEEAGVHGRIEERSFARYVRGRSSRSARNSGTVELTVYAHLCEVTHLEPPEEANRNPIWLSAEKAKRRLREGRGEEYGSELARIVDRAAGRIQWLRRANNQLAPGPMYGSNDALQKVLFIDEGREGRRQPAIILPPDKKRKRFKNRGL
jgi:8-oxo-dGTP pyrophosphatase MutT (NUDIX family)